MTKRRIGQLTQPGDAVFVSSVSLFVAVLPDEEECFRLFLHERGLLLNRTNVIRRSSWVREKLWRIDAQEDA